MTLAVSLTTGSWSTLAQTPVSCITPTFATPRATELVFESDLERLDSLIARDAVAMGMANQAMTLVSDSRVRRMALRIIESRAGEIQLMRHVRSLWYPDAQAPTVTASLPYCETSENPDLSFLSAMIDHQRVSVAVLAESRASADHSELSDLARVLLEVRQQEIETMTALLDEISGSAT
ncbi:MAG: DUF305 domain-containing protein [Thermomicrobiales bacterium]